MGMSQFIHDFILIKHGTHNTAAFSLKIDYHMKQTAKKSCTDLQSERVAILMNQIVIN